MFCTHIKTILGDKLDANQLASAVKALAISISSTHSVKDTMLLSTIFVQLGDTLALLSAK